MRMKWFVGGLLVIAMAGPAYPQNKDMLRLQADMITMQQQVKQLQASVDANNSVMKAMVEKMADQINSFSGAVSGAIQKLSQAVDGVRAQNETTAKEMRTILTGLNAGLGELHEGLSSVRAQINSVSQQVTTIKTTAEPLAGPNDLWREAMVNSYSGLYDLAISAFQEFLSKYPNDPHAPDAQLGIANALFSEKKFEPAIDQYDLVLQKYPDSDTSRAALLKKGLAQAETNQPQAKDTLNEVVKKFPKTSEATTAQAKLRELTSAQRSPAR